MDITNATMVLVEVENAIVVFVGATVVLVEVTNATRVQFHWNRF